MRTEVVKEKVYRRKEIIELYKAGERNFAEFNLSNANLSGADLTDANLSGANLS
ncbi:MAG: pentapeptide repeat-containing protein, partial [Candidatus Micrarchaeia archaeon]